MPYSNIPVNTKYSHRALEAPNIWAHHQAMKNVKKLRKAKRLSQVELAEAVGCTQGMISKIEKGIANPTLELIEAIAQALKVSPVSLFGLPEAQQRAVFAIENIEDLDLRESALSVLENMSRRKPQSP